MLAVESVHQVAPGLLDKLHERLDEVVGILQLFLQLLGLLGQLLHGLGAGDRLLCRNCMGGRGCRGGVRVRVGQVIDVQHVELGRRDGVGVDLHIALAQMTTTLRSRLDGSVRLGTGTASATVGEIHDGR